MGIDAERTRKRQRDTIRSREREGETWLPECAQHRTLNHRHLPGTSRCKNWERTFGSVAIRHRHRRDHEDDGLGDGVWPTTAASETTASTNMTRQLGEDEDEDEDDCNDEHDKSGGHHR